MFKDKALLDSLRQHDHILLLKNKDRRNISAQLLVPYDKIILKVRDGSLISKILLP